MNRKKMNVETNRQPLKEQTFRRAFTLVELLVVIAIMGTLVALLLPAVNAAREAARKTTCGNNIRQVAGGCLLYHKQYQILPPASNFTNNADTSNCWKEANLRANWMILILPFIDQQPLFNEMNSMLKKSGINVETDNATSIYDTSITMKSCRETVIPVFLCASDVNNNQIKFESQKSAFTGARCNYGANMGLDFTYNLYSKWSNNLIHGVMGPGKSMKIDEMIDGASNTIMVAELRSGIVACDPRGTWSLGGAGPSAIACCGYIGDSKGPNSKNNAADDIYGCDKVEAQLDYDQLVRVGMECSNSSTALLYNAQATSRSTHPGGVQTAFCDGSVHWITDGISVGTSESNLGVWDKLLLPCDGFSISSADF